MMAARKAFEESRLRSQLKPEDLPWLQNIALVLAPLPQDKRIDSLRTHLRSVYGVTGLKVSLRNVGKSHFTAYHLEQNQLEIDHEVLDRVIRALVPTRELESVKLETDKWALHTIKLQQAAIGRVDPAKPTTKTATTKPTPIASRRRDRNARKELPVQNKKDRRSRRRSSLFGE